MRILILGITGQDGSYLADLLTEQGHNVHGLVRRSSTGNLKNIQHLLPDKITLHQGDMLDPLSVKRVVELVMPDIIYNMADQDHVGFSEFVPVYSSMMTYQSVSNLLEIILPFRRKVRLFQPLSATMFGDAVAPQNEQTPFNPQSPYAIAKTAVYYLCKLYRDKVGLDITQAIMYNHDSERRTGDYLLHKICKEVLAIGPDNWTPEKTKLHDLSYRVDIGYAKEFMEIVIKLMESDKTDVVIGTGTAHSIHRMVNLAIHFSGGIILESIDDTGGQPFSYLEADTHQLLAAIGTLPKLGVGTVIESLIKKYRKEMR